MLIALALSATSLVAQTPTPGPHPGADPVAIANRAARAYQQLNAFGCEFKQLIQDSMIGDYESKGHLVQAGTAKLAMRFTDPNGDAIVMDGQRLWVYTPSTTPGQVIRMGIPSGPKFGFSVLAWLLDRPAERYHITYVKSDKAGGRVADVIRLEPLDADLPFDRAVLWLDQVDALPRRLEIRERRGTYRTLTFTEVQPNPKLTPDTFRFDLPSGVRIVDQ